MGTNAQGYTRNGAKVNNFRCTSCLSCGLPAKIYTGATKKDPTSLRHSIPNKEHAKLLVTVCVMHSHLHVYSKGDTAYYVRPFGSWSIQAPYGQRQRRKHLRQPPRLHVVSRWTQQPSNLAPLTKTGYVDSRIWTKVTCKLTIVSFGPTIFKEGTNRIHSSITKPYRELGCKPRPQLLNILPFRTLSLFFGRLWLSQYRPFLGALLASLVWQHLLFLGTVVCNMF